MYYIILTKTFKISSFAVSKKLESVRLRSNEYKIFSINLE